MNWQKECRKIHDEGLQKISAGEKIPFRLRAFTPDGSSVGDDLIFEDGIGNQMRVLLRNVAVLEFSRMHIPAALIQSDARSVDGNKFFEYFQLSTQKPIEEQVKEYHQILHEKFDGKVENLPQELWWDTLTTCLKGPQIMPVSFLTSYKKLEDGTVRIGSTNEHDSFELGILPNWWKDTIN